jgi:hypothetical protein
MLPISHKTFYHEKLHSQNDDIRNRVLAYCKHIDPNGITVSNVGGWHSKYFKTLPIERPWRKDLIEAVTQSYHLFTAPNQPVPLEFNCWMMVYNQGDYVKDHQHLPIQEELEQYENLHKSGYPVLSGAYYVSLPDGNDKSFYIKDKANNLEYLNTNEGELTLFYSYIMHGTIPNPSDKPRVAIAFNVLPEVHSGRRRSTQTSDSTGGSF